MNIKKRKRQIAGYEIKRPKANFPLRCTELLPLAEMKALNDWHHVWLSSLQDGIFHIHQSLACYEVQAELEQQLAFSTWAVIMHSLSRYYSIYPCCGGHHANQECSLYTGKGNYYLILQHQV